MSPEERRRLCAQLREYSFQEAADEIERLAAPPLPDASAELIEVRDMFRQKAHDCDIEFKETADPAAASAAYAYTEAAGELERLRARIKENI